jgi:hypothetical protein
VALIELYAWMTEMMLYRLNQVPDRLYLKFLELMGIQQFGPTPARTDILFTLTAPQPTTVRVPISTQVSTERVGDGEPVVFMTERELSVVCPQLISCLTRGGGHYRDQWDTLRRMANRVRGRRDQPGAPATAVGDLERHCVGAGPPTVRHHRRPELPGGGPGDAAARSPPRGDADRSHQGLLVALQVDRDRARATGIPAVT